MSAVSGVGPAPPRSRGVPAVAAPVRDADRRVVAIAIDAVELLRPESDLARLLDSFGRVDVLLAAEDLPAAAVGADSDDDPDDWAQDDEVVDEVETATAALGHPDLEVHRLALRAPLGPEAEDDLVAALSELIGFDPGPRGVLPRACDAADGVLVQRRAAHRPRVRATAPALPLPGALPGGAGDRRPSRSARHRHAALLEDDPPLGLGQAAPHAERLAGLQRELAALLHHRAALAHLFGLSGAPGPRRVALTVGVEEDRAVHPAARTEPLPLPRVIHGSWKPGHVTHGHPLAARFSPLRRRLPRVVERPNPV